MTHRTMSPTGVKDVELLNQLRNPLTRQRNLHLQNPKVIKGIESIIVRPETG